MKMQIILNSDQFSEDENEKRYEKSFVINWDFPILPRIGEYFMLENFIATPIERDYNVVSLSWSVMNVFWSKNSNGEIIPELELIGE